MKVITVNLNKQHVKALQVLQDVSLYPSRSEAIRVAIRDFLQSEFHISGENYNFQINIPETNSITKKATEEKRRDILRMIRKLEHDQEQGSTGIY